MIKNYLKIFLVILIMTAQAPLDLIIDTNERDVEIQPGISGTKIVLFGATPSGKRDIIIEVVGPPKNQTMQEKRRYFGFWLGRGKSYYKNVPSYYNLLSSKPLEEITNQEGLNKLGLGIEHLPLGKADIKYSSIKQFQFDKRLRSEMSEDGQFLENEENIVLRSGPGKVGLFKTEFSLPPNSLQGKYFVRYFLFQNGEAISYAESIIDLKQAGFARLIWIFANKFALLYGIIAIILSGLLGWVVSLIFSRYKLT
ncbi:MAG: TIGR02186 family protein [Alphaproteobacteria bacterium]